MDIEFRRGDTQVVNFPLVDKNGDPVKLTENDNLYFTVKQNTNSEDVLIQKKYPENISYDDTSGYYIFTLESEDTSEMPYGTYSYDIELKSGTFVKTLGDGSITLTEEVTFRGDE